MASVLEKVRLVAAIDSSVLILGETGTGKEPHQPRRAFQQCSARNAR
jgi:transcriptional regulator with GAF, ATPase, and Fis domain